MSEVNKLNWVMNTLKTLCAGMFTCELRIKIFKGSVTMVRVSDLDLKPGENLCASIV